MNINNLSFNSQARLLIADVERSDLQMEDLDLQFKLYLRLKEAVGNHENELKPELLRRFKILKWSYDFDVYLDCQPVVCKRKTSSSRDVKRPKIDNRISHEDPVIHYKKAETKTVGLVPTHKECFAEGYFGKIFILNKEKLAQYSPDSPLLTANKDLLVKKTDLDSTEEFYVGNRLSHKNLTKSYFLFVKEYPNKKAYKIVMKRIYGSTLEDIKLLDNQCVYRYLNSVMDCALYLFEQGYLWADRHEGNMIIEYETGEIKLIDYDKWIKIDNPQVLSRELLHTSTVVMETIINKSKMRKKINSITNCVKLFQNSFKSNSREELKQQLAYLLRMIITNFEKVALNPDDYPDDVSIHDSTFESEFHSSAENNSS